MPKCQARQAATPETCKDPSTQRTIIATSRTRHQTPGTRQPMIMMHDPVARGRRTKSIISGSGEMSTLLKEIINWYASPGVSSFESRVPSPASRVPVTTSQTPRAKFQAHTSLNEQKNRGIPSIQSVLQRSGREFRAQVPHPLSSPLQLLTKSIKVAIKTNLLEWGGARSSKLGITYVYSTLHIII